MLPVSRDEETRETSASLADTRASPEERREGESRRRLWGPTLRAPVDTACVRVITARTLCSFSLARHKRKQSDATVKETIFIPMNQ